MPMTEPITDTTDNFTPRNYVRSAKEGLGLSQEVRGRVRPAA